MPFPVDIGVRRQGTPWTGCPCIRELKRGGHIQIYRPFSQQLTCMALDYERIRWSTRGKPRHGENLAHRNAWKINPEPSWCGRATVNTKLKSDFSIYLKIDGCSSVIPGITWYGVFSHVPLPNPDFAQSEITYYCVILFLKYCKQTIISATFIYWPILMFSCVSLCTVYCQLSVIRFYYTELLNLLSWSVFATTFLALGNIGDIPFFLSLTILLWLT